MHRIVGNEIVSEQRRQTVRKLVQLAKGSSQISLAELESLASVSTDGCELMNAPIPFPYFEVDG
jgi:hypothetical protein